MQRPSPSLPSVSLIPVTSPASAIGWHGSLRAFPGFREEIRPADFVWSVGWSGIADLYRPKGNVVVDTADWACIHLKPPSAASPSDLLADQCAKRGFTIRYDDKSRKVRALGYPYSYRRTSELHLDELGKDRLR